MVSCPTGALTNKTVVGTSIAAGPDAQGFEAEELLQLPVFKGISGTFLELNRGAIVKTAISCRRNYLPRGGVWLDGFLYFGRQGAGFAFGADCACKNAGRSEGTF